MTLSSIATRYASALADVVTASRSSLPAADAVAQLRSFAAALKASSELQNALISPAVPGSRKKAVVARIAEALGLAPIARNFLFVLVDHRRIAMLADTVDIFERLVDERLGYVQAQVATAQALNDEQRAALTTQFERLTGKRIRGRFAVDPSLIGGVLAHIGSTVYDGSVRGQLGSIERRLSAEV